MTRKLRAVPVALRKWKTSFSTAVKLPKFGPKLFGTTDPSMMARSGSARIAAHAAASSRYAESRAWSGSGGGQSDGTPIKELLYWTPEKFAFAAIRTRAWAIPWFSVAFVGPVCVRQAAK